jgi:stage V sporulation protein S
VLLPDQVVLSGLHSHHTTHNRAACSRAAFLFLASDGYISGRKWIYQMTKPNPDFEEPNEYTTDYSLATIRVSSDAPVSAVAGAIAGQVRENGLAEVHAIGADAVNQAIKAATVARGYLAEEGVDAIVIPFFNAATISGEERTVVRLVVEPR